MDVLAVSTCGDAGAAVVRDGRLVAAVNEERLCRMKAVKGFPRGSIRAVLNLSGLEPSDIDVVRVGARNGFLVEELQEADEWLDWDRSGGLGARVKEAASTLSPARRWFPFLEKVYYALLEPSYRKRRRGIRGELRRGFGLTCPVRFVDHHRCHAASAWHTSGFAEGLVITLDGGGDGRSGLVAAGRGHELEVLHEIPAFHSLGNYYAYATRVCGFQAHLQEGKVTGLSARGEPRYVPILREFVDEEDGTIVNRADAVFHRAVRQLRERLPEGWRPEDLAASVQAHTEDVVRRLARHWVRETGLDRVALAGGIFANVRVNDELARLPEVDTVWVHPGMTDGGLAVGAGLSACDAPPHGVGCGEPMRDVYLGPPLGEAEIREALEERDLQPVSTDAPVEEEVARRLEEGHVVARAAGRMEYGPRALGNRSILYQPTDPSAMDWLNERLDRTGFMPFAPAVRWEDRHRCFEGVDRAPRAAEFMTITFDCTRWAREEVPGVVHVDGTARPQLVRREVNPSLHRILTAYERRTGLPALINTSFNRHGEPICCTARDCVASFLEAGLDYLAIGDLLVRHPAAGDTPRGADAATAGSRV